MIDYNVKELIPSAPTEKVYPTLSLDQNTNYKVNQIILGKDYLSREHKIRKELKKKYKKLYKTLFGVEWVLVAGELSLVGLMFVAPPLAAVPLLVTSICTGLTFGTASIRGILKLTQAKIDKHRSIELIALSKLNSIEDKYIKALEDGTISYEEFKDILKEMENYNHMKDEVLLKVKNAPPVKITSEVKEALKEDGKDELKKELKAKLNL